MLHSSSSFPFGFSLQGWPQQIILLHLTLSSASSSLKPPNLMSSFTTSINLLFGLPLHLLPGSSNLNIFLPIKNLSIFISATSSSDSCLFLSATVSKPYNIAGLTTLLYTFPFILADTLLSHITPDTFLQLFHPACTRFFTS
ncbi:uncharacterized protein ACB058_005233 [Synchiropus picturatus]